MCYTCDLTPTQQEPHEQQESTCKPTLHPCPQATSRTKRMVCTLQCRGAMILSIPLTMRSDCCDWLLTYLHRKNRLLQWPEVTDCSCGGGTCNCSCCSCKCCCICCLRCRRDNGTPRRELASFRCSVNDCFLRCFTAPPGQRWQWQHNWPLRQPPGFQKKAHGLQFPVLCSADPILASLLRVAESNMCA